ncbi:MAG TPA: aldehyde dehydrogenase family protein, partial [Gammaproteobacteria bacterium]|nr:aldehyde dehydrogenase family protein [Gammaproteobacteria bacterium]
RSFKFRETQLLGLMRFMEEYESAIKAALYEDLRKPAQEAFMVEIAIVKREIRETLRHLSSWMSPKKVSTFFAAQPATSFVQADPLGVVLIIAPWNYPVQLALMPLIGAIAAGNCAIVKPSEFAPRTSHLLATFLPKYLDRKCFQVIEGAIPETSALLAEKFDHIFFTGSPNVGKIVALAAAKNLTPTTLELGGKSPCIVDDSANLAVAAERIVWGKFSNAGQTCIAPDYVLVDKDVEEKLLFYIKEKIKEFYGANPKESKDFGRIVNKQHYDRLLKILSENGDIFLGGEACEGERYIAPTVLKNVSASYSIMDKDTEIFGPILPVVTFDKVGDVISFVNSRPKPLTIYLFSENPQMVELVRKNTSSGSLVVNHTLLQGGVLTLPFGGVGESGMGAYHGKKSFDTFSHQKAVFNKTTHWNLFDVSSYVIYPPYSGTKETLLRLTI